MAWPPKDSSPKGPGNQGDYDLQKSVDDFLGQFKKNAPSFWILILLFVGIPAVTSCFYTVQPQQEAVVTRFGKYVGTTSPGLHFKLPFGIDRVSKIETAAVLQETFGFSADSLLGSSREEESLMLTGDLNVAEVQWTVQFQIAEPAKYLFNHQNPQETIRDISEATMRRVVGDRTVDEVLTVGRERIAEEARRLTQEALDKYDIGVKVLLVNLQDVNPPGPVQASFNEVNAAQQEQEQGINVARAHYNKIIPEARGKAEEEISKARGYATAIVNRARGESEQFSKVAAEYQRAPELTRSRLYLETLEQVLRRGQSVTIVDPSLKGIIPIINQGAGAPPMTTQATANLAAIQQYTQDNSGENTNIETRGAR